MMETEQQRVSERPAPSPSVPSGPAGQQVPPPPFQLKSAPLASSPDQDSQQEVAESESLSAAAGPAGQFQLADAPADTGDNEGNEGAAPFQLAADQSAPARGAGPVLGSVLDQALQTQVAEGPAQFVPAMPGVLDQAVPYGPHQPGPDPSRDMSTVAQLLRALSMILSGELGAETTAETVGGNTSPYNPGYYSGSGMPPEFLWGLWDFYKARWESGSRGERRRWITRGVQKLRFVFLPRIPGLFPQEFRSRIRELINEEIRQRYQAINNESGSRVLRTIPETQAQPEGEGGGPAGAEGRSAARRPRRRRQPQRTEEQRAVDQEFQEASEQLIERRVSEADRSTYAAIDEANSETESGRRYQRSRIGTSAGQPASLGRGQLLVQLQINRTIDYLQEDSRISELIQQHSSVTVEQLQQMRRYGRAAIRWYERLSGHSELEDDATGVAIRQLRENGQTDQILSRYGSQFRTETNLAPNEMRYMGAWSTMRDDDNRSEYRSLLTATTRRIGSFRRSHREAYMALRRPPGSRRWAMGRREATVALINQLKEAGTLTGEDQILAETVLANENMHFDNIQSAGNRNKIAIAIFGTRHPEIRTLLGAHQGERNQLNGTALHRYLTGAINNEDKNGWFTRAAMSHPGWAEFERILWDIDLYSTQDRSLDNFTRARGVANDISGFDQLEGHTRAIFLGQMARMNHGGGGRFLAMYRGDESEAAHQQRIEAWERANPRPDERHPWRVRAWERQHPRRRMRRRGRMRWMSEFADPTSVENIRLMYRQLWGVNSRIAKKIRTSLCNWTRNYLSIQEISAGDVDIFIPNLNPERMPMPEPEEEAEEAVQAEGQEAEAAETPEETEAAAAATE